MRMTQICHQLWDLCSTKLEVISFCGRCKQRNSGVYLWIWNTKRSKQSELRSLCSPHHCLLKSKMLHDLSLLPRWLLPVHGVSPSELQAESLGWVLQCDILMPDSHKPLTTDNYMLCLSSKHTHTHTRMVFLSKTLLQFQILKLPPRRATLPSLNVNLLATICKTVAKNWWLKQKRCSFDNILLFMFLKHLLSFYRKHVKC